MVAVFVIILLFAMFCVAVCEYVLTAVAAAVNIILVVVFLGGGVDFIGGIMVFKTERK